MVNRVFGLLMISVFLMSCNSTGFLSNGGDDGKKSRSIEAGSNAEIGYRNGRFLPTEEELEILTSAENSKMVDYDLDEALDAVENSFTEDLGIALVDLELENPKDAELAIDHALVSFTTADIAALTQIQEGTNEDYDPYFEFEKEYGYSISESDRFNIVHFPELIVSSNESSSLRLYESEINEDNFTRNNGVILPGSNHFLNTTLNENDRQKIADDWNSKNPDLMHRLEYLGNEDGAAYELRAKEGINAVSRGWKIGENSSHSWVLVPNSDGGRNVYHAKYNQAGKEVGRFIHSFNKYGRQKIQNCPNGYTQSNRGVCKKLAETEITWETKYPDGTTDKETFNR